MKQAFLYTEIAEGMNAYGVSRHRHMPEIEQVGPRPCEWCEAGLAFLLFVPRADQVF